MTIQNRRAPPSLCGTRAVRDRLSGGHERAGRLAAAAEVLRAGSIHDCHLADVKMAHILAARKKVFTFWTRGLYFPQVHKTRQSRPDVLMVREAKSSPEKGLCVLFLSYSPLPSALRPPHARRPVPVIAPRLFRLESPVQVEHRLRRAAVAVGHAIMHVQQNLPPGGKGFVYDARDSSDAG